MWNAKKRVNNEGANQLGPKVKLNAIEDVVVENMLAHLELTVAVESIFQ